MVVAFLIKLLGAKSSNLGEFLKIIFCFFGRRVLSAPFALKSYFFVP
jgi:hypothetical protein